MPSAVRPFCGRKIKFGPHKLELAIERAEYSGRLTAAGDPFCRGAVAEDPTPARPAFVPSAAVQRIVANGRNPQVGSRKLPSHLAKRFPGFEPRRSG
jgi:hypothetical protein